MHTSICISYKRKNTLVIVKCIMEQKKCKNKTLSIQRVYSTLSDDSFKDDSSEEISGAVQRCCIVFVQINWWIGLSKQQSLFKFQQISNCIIAQTLLKENITAFKWQFDSYFFFISFKWHDIYLNVYQNSINAICGKTVWN